MNLSHSKLNTITKCPATYYLNYELGISTVAPKTALQLGSAVHWGIENNTEDLEQFFKDANKGSLYDFLDSEALAEAMVHGYFKHKDEIFDELLRDLETGEKLELLDETHELFVNGKLKGKFEHKFVGIVDLLLLTEKGWIIVDYKTSAFEPNWDDYMDQLYRYIFLLRCEFPEVPVYKIAIINLRKAAIRQKKTENQEEFRMRLKNTYEENSLDYVNYHIYNPKDLDEDLIDAYIKNLATQCDAAQTIVDNDLYYINFSEANGKYGKSDYWNIFYNIPNSEVLYKITDKIWNEEEEKFDESRPCVDTDMLVLNYKNVMCKYEQFKIQALAYYSVHKNVDFDAIEEFINNSYIINKELLEKYYKTLLVEIKNGLK